MHIAFTSIWGIIGGIAVVSFCYLIPSIIVVITYLCMGLKNGK